MENQKKPLSFVDLVEKLLNESKKKKAKSKSKGNEKMADKDYDGDGEVETSKEEYFGSKDKAIKKAMGKKQIVSKKKKQKLDEGRVVTDGIFSYGGFPRQLNETNGVVDQFNDSDDRLEGKKINGVPVATLPDSEDDNLYVPGNLGLRYPSREYRDIAIASRTADEELGALGRERKEAHHTQYRAHMKGYAGGTVAKARRAQERSRSFVFQPDPELESRLTAAQERAKAARAAQESHPHHETFMKAAQRHSELVRGPYNNAD